MSRRECPAPQPDCPLRRCFSDTHHLYWPRNQYRTPAEREFRELPENKVQLCRREHNEEHFGEPPEKPTREEMVQAIAQSIGDTAIAS